MLQNLTPETVMATLGFARPAIEQALSADKALFPEMETLPSLPSFRALEEWVPSAARRLGLDVDLAWLAVMIRLSLHAAKEYRRQNIGDKTYWDTMADILVWQRNHLQKTGRIGLSEQAWLYKHISLAVFRLGRLQFEPFFLNDPLAGKYNGAAVLSVHIPQGEPLDIAACEASLAQAADYWKRSFACFFCESWLLDPQLSKVLPPSSNIILFQSKFTVFRVDQDDSQMRERVFDMAPVQGAETSLQRRIREALAQGLTFGMGHGIIPLA